MADRRVLAALALGLGLTVAPFRHADACAAMGRSGAVPIAGEEALIVWDELRHIEHFVRRAHFTGMTEDFGFVVPTPSRPTLTEVSDDVFDRLYRLYRRPPVRDHDPSERGRRSAGALDSGGSVTVLEESVVAGLTSTILSADSPTALDAWLAEHGYQGGPELVAYLSPYVRDGWYLTAFRVAPASGGSARPLTMRAVRMSFATETPIFPYAEPQVPGRVPRPFRVSVVARQRMSGRLGDAPWGASVGFARRAPTLITALRGIVPTEARRGRLWITTFDERRSARGTLDLTFVPSDDTEPVPSTIDSPITASRAAEPIDPWK